MKINFADLVSEHDDFLKEADNVIGAACGADDDTRTDALLAHVVATMMCNTAQSARNTAAICERLDRLIDLMERAQA